MAEGSGSPDISPQPEAPKSSPTETSKGFLKYWLSKELLPGFKRTGPYLLLGPTAFLGEQILGDIGRGDYRSAAVKGVIAGLSAAPIITKGIRSYRNT